MSIYRKNHLTVQRNRWRYKRRVPSKLVPLVGAAYWTKYLGAISSPEAEVEARKLDVAHDNTIARLNALKPTELAELTAGGGVAKVERHADSLAHVLPVVEAHAIHFKESDVDLDAEDVGERIKLIRESHAEGKALRSEIQAKRTLVSKAKGAPSSKIANLIPVWKNVAAPRGSKAEQRMHLYVKRFVEVVGNLEPRDVRREHAVKFRNALEARGTTKSNTKQQLDALHRLFAVALSENKVEQNPFFGVKVKKDPAAKFSDADRRRPFNVEQIEAILAAAEKLDADRKWIIRLLAYHGARSGEICQLRPQDVTTVAGIPVLRITDEAGSLKNRFSKRDVPIHPACMEIVDIAQRASGKQWLFHSFTAAPGKAAAFQNWASDFVRRIVGSDRTLTLHSLRHTWRTVARNIEMPGDVSRSIMGHALGKDDHAAYGEPPALRKRAAWMAKVDPLSA